MYPDGVCVTNHFTSNNNDMLLGICDVNVDLREVSKPDSWLGHGMKELVPARV